MLRNEFLNIFLNKPDDAGGGGGDPEPKQKNQDPPKNPNQDAPKGFTEEEVLKRVEQARQEEKGKLYEQISSLKSKAETADKDKAELQNQIETLKEQMAAIEKAKSKEGDIDVSKLIEEVTASSSKEHAKQLTALQREVEQLREENKKSALEAYRARKIGEAGGQDALITAMVSGSSEQEIDNSIERARAEHERIVSRFGKPAPKQEPASPEGKQNEPAPSVPPKPKPPAEGGEPTLEGLQGVRELSPAEYAKKRREILDAAKKRFAKGAAA